MSASELIDGIEESIAAHEPRELRRAACWALVVSDYDGYDETQALRLRELARHWWGVYETLSESDRAQIDRGIVKHFRAVYPPGPRDIRQIHSAALPEPVEPFVNAMLTPITVTERDLILSRLEDDDGVREVFEYAGAVGPDGALPLPPLLVDNELVVYGHAIVRLYREGTIGRTWGVRRTRWEYQLLEDTLLARAVTEGRLSGHARNTYALYTKPYVPRLAERQILNHARRIERDLVRRGLFERINRHVVACSDACAQTLVDDLIPAWLEFAIETPEISP